MDTDTLVENKIEDGLRLITLLQRDQFDVRVAFWAKTSEQGLWQLWIASAAVDPTNLGDLLHKVYNKLDQIEGHSIGPSDVTLITAEHPTARAALELRDRYSSRK